MVGIRMRTLEFHQPAHSAKARDPLNTAAHATAISVDTSGIAPVRAQKRSGEMPHGKWRDTRIGHERRRLLGRPKDRCYSRTRQRIKSTCDAVSQRDGSIPQQLFQKYHAHRGICVVVVSLHPTVANPSLVLCDSSSLFEPASSAALPRDACPFFVPFHREQDSPAGNHVPHGFGQITPLFLREFVQEFEDSPRSIRMLMVLPIVLFPISVWHLLKLILYNAHVLPVSYEWVWGGKFSV